jgi:hypothetical protein
MTDSNTAQETSGGYRRAASNTFLTVRTATEYLRVVGHGGGWKERVTVFLPHKYRMLSKISFWRACYAIQ